METRFLHALQVACSHAHGRARARGSNMAAVGSYLAGAEAGDHGACQAPHRHSEVRSPHNLQPPLRLRPQRVLAVSETAKEHSALQGSSRQHGKHAVKQPPCTARQSARGQRQGALPAQRWRTSGARCRRCKWRAAPTGPPPVNRPRRLIYAEERGASHPHTYSAVLNDQKAQRGVSQAARGASCRTWEAGLH